jgi:hypothetical protein
MGNARTALLDRVGAVVLLVAATSILGGARGEAAERTAPTVSMTGGLGNSTGGLGLQGEYYFAQGRASLFLGAGYWPSSQDGARRHPGSAAGALGGRVFTSGFTHRALLEASVSEIGWEQSAEGSKTKRLYGPGLQVGYQHVAKGGFTFLVSGGVAYALGAQIAPKGAFAVGQIAVGHTWQ